MSWISWISCSVLPRDLAPTTLILPGGDGCPPPFQPLFNHSSTTRLPLLPLLPRCICSMTRCLLLNPARACITASSEHQPHQVMCPPPLGMSHSMSPYRRLPYQICSPGGRNSTGSTSHCCAAQENGVRKTKTVLSSTTLVSHDISHPGAPSVAASGVRKRVWSVETGRQGDGEKQLYLLYGTGMIILL